MSIVFRIFTVKINQIPIIDITHNFCTKYGKILEICMQIEFHHSFLFFAVNTVLCVFGIRNVSFSNGIRLFMV